MGWCWPCGFRASTHPCGILLVVSLVNKCWLSVENLKSQSDLIDLYWLILWYILPIRLCQYILGQSGAPICSLGVCRVDNTHTINWSKNLQILFTCKSIFVDSRKIFYVKKHWPFVSWSKLLMWFSSIFCPPRVILQCVKLSWSKM